MKFALLLLLFADSEGFVNLPPAGPGAIVVPDERGGDPTTPSSSAPSPAAFTIDPELFGRLVESQSVAAPEPVRFVAYVRRVGCVHCKRMVVDVGDGDDEASIEYVYDEGHPAWMRDQMVPYIVCKATNTYVIGYHTLAQLKSRFHVAPQVVAAPAPIPGGTFDASLIEKYLPLVAYARIDARLPTQTIEIPGVDVELTGGTVAVVHNQGVTRLTFSESLPTVKYGFLKIECSGVVYNAGMLDVQLKSFPDVKFKAR